MTSTTFLGGKVTLHCGDSRDVLREFPDNHFDSVCTDPPYALVSIGKRFGGQNASLPNKGDGNANVYNRTARGFMGKAWDNGDAAFAVDFWAQVLRVLKPGGHVAAFGGDRTIHRLVCAIEDAGFEIRGTCAWIFGSGFPKSLNVSKQIDKEAGNRRGTTADLRNGPNTNPLSKGSSKFGGYPNTGTVDLDAGAVSDDARKWEGWGTALKPAMELVCLARKPLSEPTVAANVLRWGCGAINVDACRIKGETPSVDRRAAAARSGNFGRLGDKTNGDHGKLRANGNREEGLANYLAGKDGDSLGRWPANLVHDNSPEVLAGFPETHSAGAARSGSNDPRKQNWSGNVGNAPADRSTGEMFRVGDAGGSAARFFYQAKADQDSRMASRHPTVKPVALMQWLVRLITPPGGVTCDPFAGTGTTGEAAWREGFSAILIEREVEYQADIARRMEYALTGPDTRSRAIAKAKSAGKAEDHGPLFAEDTA